jgi:1-phosphofructokinase
LATLGDIVDAANEIRDRGVGAVLASLGADGAVLVDNNGALHGEAPVQCVVSTVGAGDAMLAGYLAGDAMLAGSLVGRPSRERALATALEWGAAAVQHEGTLFSPASAPVDVIIHDTIDRARRLSRDEPAPRNRTPADDITTNSSPTMPT